MSYVKDLDQFRLTPKGCLNHYVFKRKTPSGSAVTDRLYCYNIEDMNKKSIVLAAVSQNVQRFTAREVNPAMKAKTMMARLGFPSMMLGIEVDSGEAGGHVPRIERKIRTIKVRTVRTQWGEDFLLNSVH